MINKEIIDESINYMFQHISDEITVKDIASHFHFSEAYFNRGFKLVTGESVYHFMKQIKINQSAIDLKLKKNKTISDVGLDYGYTSSNYSTVFKLHHSLSPSEFRKYISATKIANPFMRQVENTFDDFETYNSKIRIQELEDIKVIYQRVFGSYGNLKEKWLQFFVDYKNYINDDTIMIERFFDDPAISSADSCLCDLCATVSEDCMLENTITLKGGRFAVYGFAGEIKDIFPALQGVFSVWFPQSDYEMAERYGFNIYRSINMETGFVELDLCIPIE